MYTPWPKGTEEHDILWGELFPQKLGSHQLAVISVAAVDIRSAYGDSLDYRYWIRREGYCSCGAKVINDLNKVDDIRVPFMWHIMENEHNDLHLSRKS